MEEDLNSRKKLLLFVPSGIMDVSSSFCNENNKIDVFYLNISRNQYPITINDLKKMYAFLKENYMGSETLAGLYNYSSTIYDENHPFLRDIIADSLACVGYDYCFFIETTKDVKFLFLTPVYFIPYGEETILLYDLKNTLKKNFFNILYISSESRGFLEDLYLSILELDDNIIDIREDINKIKTKISDEIIFNDLFNAKDKKHVPYLPSYRSELKKESLKRLEKAKEHIYNYFHEKKEGCHFVLSTTGYAHKYYIEVKQSEI